MSSDQTLISSARLAKSLAEINQSTHSFFFLSFFFFNSVIKGAGDGTWHEVCINFNFTAIC